LFQLIDDFSAFCLEGYDRKCIKLDNGIITPEIIVPNITKHTEPVTHFIPLKPDPYIEIAVAKNDRPIPSITIKKVMSALDFKYLFFEIRDNNLICSIGANNISIKGIKRISITINI